MENPYGSPAPWSLRSQEYVKIPEKILSTAGLSRPTLRRTKTMLIQVPSGSTPRLPRLYTVDSLGFSLLIGSIIKCCGLSAVLRLLPSYHWPQQLIPTLLQLAALSTTGITADVAYARDRPFCDPESLSEALLRRF